MYFDINTRSPCAHRNSFGCRDVSPGFHRSAERRKSPAFLTHCERSGHNRSSLARLHVLIDCLPHIKSPLLHSLIIAADGFVHEFMRSYLRFQSAYKTSGKRRSDLIFNHNFKAHLWTYQQEVCCGRIFGKKGEGGMPLIQPHNTFTTE